MIIEFSIPYVPGPKQSTRFTRFGKHVSYPDTKVVRDATSLASLMAPYRPERPLDGAVQMRITIEYPWLAKHTKISATTVQVPKTTRPDCDQLAKQMLDVLQKVGFLADDARVYELTISKWHSETGPRTTVAITAAETKP